MSGLAGLRNAGRWTLTGPGRLGAISRLALAFPLCLCMTPGAFANELPPALQRVLSAHGVPVDGVSILVQSLNEDTPRIALNIDTPRNPASSIKLVSTFVALDVLGPTYTWPTEIYALGPVSGDTINGDLLFKGYGDPHLVTEELWKLLGSLTQRGIRHINGDLVIDDTYFAGAQTDPGAFDNKPFRLYNVAPNAFLVNFKAAEFRFTLKGRDQVTIQTVPALANLTVENKVTVGDGPCGNNRLRINMDVPDRQRSNRIIFSGVLPRDCRGYSVSRSVLEPATYAYGLIKTLWGQWGGTLSGGVRGGAAPAKANPLLVWQSRPLAELIRDLNKWSNNVMARTLLYTLAATRFDPPVTREQGVEVVTDYLNANQIDTTGLVIDNGAGLSRKTRISARQMTALLRHAYSSRFMPEFVASLSIVGLDGTMRKQFRGKPEAGRMHVKTGRLNNVVAIAGYVLSRSGETLSVVLLVNHNKVHFGLGTSLQNALLSWAYNQ